MMGRLGRFAILLLALLLLTFLTSNCQAQGQEDEQLCACNFREDDPPDCRVYNQLGDDVLIPWHRASQACLDVFQIKDQAIDPALLDSIYGGDPSSGGNVNALVSYLRFNGGTTVANGIMLSMDQYFVEGTTTGSVVFKDTITDLNGNTVNCEENQGDCWNVVRDYLNTEQGQTVMVDIGETMYNQQAVSLEKEQSLVRIRLCAEGGTPECEPLSTQVQDKVTELAGSKDCSAFGLGPRTDNLPFCESSGSGSSSGGYEFSTTTTGTAEETSTTTEETSSSSANIGSETTTSNNVAETKAESSAPSFGGGSVATILWSGWLWIGILLARHH